MTDISAAIGKPNPDFPQRTGISLEELSFKAGLNAAHLGQIERGLRNPTIETLNRIATALDISFYELIGSVEEVPQKQPETNEIKRKIGRTVVLHDFGRAEGHTAHHSAYSAAVLMKKTKRLTDILMWYQSVFYIL